MEKGTICWFGITVTDLKKSQSFYAEIFGWQFEAKDAVLIIVNNKAQLGHMYECKERVHSECAPVMYIVVESVDQTTEKVKAFGGTIAKEKTEITPDQGFYVHIKDFDGNIFGIYSLQ